MPSKMVTRGAKTAIGFKNTIDCIQANKWIQIFFQEMLNGKTVTDAVTAASEDMTPSDGLDFESIVICGDKNYRLGE